MLREELLWVGHLSTGELVQHRGQQGVANNLIERYDHSLFPYLLPELMLSNILRRARAHKDQPSQKVAMRNLHQIPQIL